jgi:uncharacterized protein YdaU (DUF1376 family)
MTSRCHWMPFYPCDYLADTGHLSTLEHGAYLLLIMHYWQKGSLPDDEKEFATICRLPPYRWHRMRDKISRLFHDGWKHKRIEEELAKAQALREKRSDAGKAGAQQTNARYYSAPQKRANNGFNPLKNNDAVSAFADTSTVTFSRDNNISPKRAQAREAASQLVELLNRPFAETFGYGRETDTDVAFPAVRAISYQGWGREIPPDGLPDSA